MSFTWDVVDAVVAALRDKQVGGASDRQRLAEAYEAWKRRAVVVHVIRDVHDHCKLLGELKQWHDAMPS